MSSSTPHWSDNLRATRSENHSVRRHDIHFATYLRFHWLSPSMHTKRDIPESYWSYQKFVSARVHWNPSRAYSSGQLHKVRLKGSLPQHLLYRHICTLTTSTLRSRKTTSLDNESPHSAMTLILEDAATKRSGRANFETSGCKWLHYRKMAKACTLTVQPPVPG